MSRRSLVFYFDYISHNAYLAWARLAELSARHGVEFELVPVVFGALLKAHDQLGPAEVRPKALWMLKDVVRKAALAGIPLAPPHSHPFNPLLPLRMTCLPLAEQERARLVAALFEAVWARSLEVSAPEVAARVASEAGLDGPALVEAAGSDAVKARLRSHTDTALERGVFGVPSVWAPGQLFWGYDDLPNLERWLRGEDPVADLDFAAWAQIRPSIVRRR